jgi:short-subunit dehydrogenase
MKGIEGKTYLITGISSAIGTAVAIKILEEGGNVIGTHRSKLTGILEFLNANPNVKMIQWDALENPEFIQGIEILDGWVNCIGSINPQPIKYMNETGRDTLFEVNYFSCVKLANAILLHNRFNPGASIVFMSSVSSMFPYRGGSMYAASKAALESFAKSLALETSGKKIRVNTLVCALVKTPMFDASVKAYSDEDIKKIESKYPLGIGEPNDVAEPCMFLLSDAARWITGSSLQLDGGLLLDTSNS